MTRETRKVIQDLKIVDVLSSHRLCSVCGQWKSGSSVDGVHWKGVTYVTSVCPSCQALSEDQKNTIKETRRKELRSKEYYLLNEELRLYRPIVEEGVTVAELVAFLKGLEQDAYIATRYYDPDEGEVFIVPDTGSPDVHEVLGTKYYLLSGG
jgi:hypothetical protein